MNLFINMTIDMTVDKKSLKGIGNIVISNVNYCKIGTEINLPALNIFML